MMETRKGLSPYDVSVINAALNAGARVEIVPTENGAKIYTVKRKELNK